MEKFRSVAQKTVQVLLGIFFIVSAVAKVASMESFELYVFSFGFAGFDLCSIAARLLIVFEGLLGIGLVLDLLKKPVCILTAVSLGIFSLFLLWRVALGDHDSCHCMGDLVDLDPLQSILKNVVLALLLFFVWRGPDVWPWKKKWLGRHQWTVMLVMGAVLAGLLFSMSAPDLFFRKGRVSEDLVEDEFIPVADSLGLDKGRRMVCFYSATCEHCRHCASKMSSIISRHNIPMDSVMVIFMQTSEAQDSVVTDFYRQYGNGLTLPYVYMHPFNFIPLTNGSMPLVILFEDGKRVKEYDYLSLDESEISDFFKNDFMKNKI